MNITAFLTSTFLFFNSKNISKVSKSDDFLYILNDDMGTYNKDFLKKNGINFIDDDLLILQNQQNKTFLRK